MRLQTNFGKIGSVVLVHQITIINLRKCTLVVGVTDWLKVHLEKFGSGNKIDVLASLFGLRVWTPGRTGYLEGLPTHTWSENPSQAGYSGWACYLCVCVCVRAAWPGTGMLACTWQHGMGKRLGCVAYV